MSTDNTPQPGERPTEEVTVTVNGEAVTREVEPRLKLSDFLRSDCGLRGVRVGCEHGVCGACTVLMDGRGVKSCLTYAVQADGMAVETVEGLAEGEALHPIQESFHATHALQCGFCTSGFVMATKELLAENPDPSREEIETGLSDNVCRCTGYQNIYEAVERAADRLVGDPEGSPAEVADGGGDGAREQWASENRAHEDVDGGEDANAERAGGEVADAERAGGEEEGSEGAD